MSRLIRSFICVAVVAAAVAGGTGMAAAQKGDPNAGRAVSAGSEPSVAVVGLTFDRAFHEGERGKIRSAVSAKLEAAGLRQISNVLLMDVEAQHPGPFQCL